MKSELKPVLNEEDERKVKEAIISEIVNHPPTIGLIGVSGTGKSSTINSMFKTDLPVSHVVACTKEFRDTDMKVSMRSGQAAGHETVLRVVDAPGLGEDVSLDPVYLDMYRKNLVRCDVILWVLAARNRAIALDQRYLKELHEFGDRIVFGINQVDLVEPMDWNHKTNLPSDEQVSNINVILKDRKEKIESVMGKPVKMVAYSAKHKWHLQEIFTTLVESCQPKRAWIFSALKAFKPEDFLPESVRDEIWRMVEKQEEPTKKRRFRR